ncbi:agrin-like isoform X2 [Haliotis asinina]|uniref:agrin-like isoform X2 n=1 Tax=Haliotis asinina TaxID=109174 RepID=UPI00353199C6
MELSRSSKGRLCLTGLVLIVSLQFTCGRPKSPCVDQPLEYREEVANVVISGTVKEIMPDANGKNMYKSEVEIKRVFKGDNVVNAHVNFEDPVTHRKMLMIKGFGDESICDSEVRKFDTRIFLLDDGANGDLKLNSSIVRISLRNLEHMDALVKDIPYKKPDLPKKSPCETNFCAFGAKCMVNSTSGTHYCKCDTSCDDIFAPVCGTDKVTYINECHLNRESCRTKRRIKVKVQGQCGKKNPCEDHPCNFGAICVPSLDGTSHRCTCQNRCDSYGDNVGSTPVCGNNGVDYKNMCELERAACTSMKEIRVKYFGKCDPCEGFPCENPKVCHLDKQRKPTCRCNIQCSNDFEPVCATNGRTYSNECLLRREACKARKNINILYGGECTPGINIISPGPVQDDYKKDVKNPCDKIRCGAEEECSVDREGHASCVCPPPCQPVVRQVCGNDSTTYDSECELRRQSCAQKVYVVVAHTGPCGHDIPCRTFRCDYGAVCVVRHGQPSCQCPSCNEDFDPVCGEDGITYNNECKLRQEKCQHRVNIRIKHKGPCNGCENVKCDFHAVCNSDGHRAECVCIEKCTDVTDPVCGDDGNTYKNECLMKVTSCRYRKFISKASGGKCSRCAGQVCRFGSSCENGVCVCPILCETTHKPICANNGQTYVNRCDMRRAACAQNMELDVDHEGECPDHSGSGDEGSGDFMEKCDETTCRFGGVCTAAWDGFFTCECNFNCEALRSPVCGSDGKSYPNRCQMEYESCQQQKEILIQDSDNCDDFGPEEPCDGNMPLVNEATGMDYNCSSGRDKCPAGSYCHQSLTFSKCCGEEKSISQCSDTQYGCCSDNLTPSPDYGGHGCPEYCHCNKMGSYKTTCHPVTRQCSCKPGVGGVRCDRCLPGYWGMHLIEQKGNVGCIPCNCNMRGAVREDCTQMSGRCMCRPNISGMKCNLCLDKKLLGPLGCEVSRQPTSCAELNCQFGSICKEKNGQLFCDCSHFCSGYDDEVGKSVCGSDGNNFPSECRLRQFGCQMQQDIHIQYYGHCRAAPSIRTTTPMPSTTRSRKTTRHITGPIPPEVDEAEAGTDQPSTPEVEKTACGLMGKIDDLCLEDYNCCVNNSRCQLGLCTCFQGYVPSVDNRQCIEVVRSDPIKTEDIDNACMHSPCENGGECELDDSLGYRCVCPLGKTGPLCKEDNAFSVPSFSGKSYLKVPRIRKANKNLNIEVVFQTLNKDGILLFNSQNKNGSGDFISLAIKDGFIEFRYNLGGGESTVRSKTMVTLKKSHRVVIKRRGENAILIMDNEDPVSGASDHTHTSLNLGDPLFIGFVPNALPDVYNRIGVSLGLVGCIHVLKAGNEGNLRNYNLEYPNRNTDIADGADIGECGNNPCKSMPCQNEGACIMQDQRNYKCLCREGFTGLLCEILVDPCASQPCQYGGTCITMGNDVGYECLCTEGRSGTRCEKESLKRVFVPQFSGDAYMELPLEDNVGKQLTIEVWFKAFKPNGVILFATQFNGGKGDFISLNMVKRKLQFRFSLGDRPAKLETNNHIHLNKWHRVVITRLNENGQMTLDKRPTVKGKAPGTMKELNLGRPLYIGGYKGESSLPAGAEITANFSGAIQRITINGKTIDSLMESAEEMRNIEEYAGAPCNMNPCMNGGVCIPKLNDADCRCPLEFMGERCEKRAEHVDKDQPVKFDGNTYLQYPNEKTQKSQAQRINNIKIKFRTKERNGLIAFQNKGTSVMGDYLAVAVVNEHVELSFNLGKQSEKNLFKIRSTVPVSDGNWHMITAIRELSEGRLQVDSETMLSSMSGAGASQLDTDGNLWIGGKPDLPWGLPPEYYSGFTGCIDEVMINRVDLHLVEDRETHSSTIAFCS